MNRAVLELLHQNLSDDLTSAILDAVLHNPKPAAAVRSLLEGVNIPAELRADLWDLRFAPGKPMSLITDAISDKAAAEVWRQVFAEYQAFNELGPRDRTGQIQDFLLSVEAQIRIAIPLPFAVFRQQVLAAEPFRWERRHDIYPSILAAGRYFIQSGIWPVTFGRGQ